MLRSALAASAFLFLFVFDAAAILHARPIIEKASVISGYAPGTIVISQSARRLFLIELDGGLRSYPVAVGKAGKAWLGSARINGKYVAPAWSPPADVKRDHPRLPGYIPGGSPDNPMGAGALTLDRAEIAIHGTSPSMRASIGRAASYGCIRMLNEDVMDLFGRVEVGAQVIAIP
jgi:lipoprotein-anchoring transpeptidase ErfK/SrfK